MFYTVSYTHLDVYKRQVDMYLSADDGTIISIFLRGLLITSPNLIPAHIAAPEDKSICHSFCGCHYFEHIQLLHGPLDVYKRQNVLVLT